MSKYETRNQRSSRSPAIGEALSLIRRGLVTGWLKLLCPGVWVVRVVTAEDYTICRRVLDPFTISPSRKRKYHVTPNHDAGFVSFRSLPILLIKLSRLRGIFLEQIPGFLEGNFPNPAKCDCLAKSVAWFVELSTMNYRRREKGGVPWERKWRAVEDFRVNLRAKVDGPPANGLWLQESPRTHARSSSMFTRKLIPTGMLDAAGSDGENAGCRWGGCSLVGLHDDNNKRRSVPSCRNVFSLLLVSFSRDRCPSPFFPVSPPLLPLSFSSSFLLLLSLGVRWCARARVFPAVPLISRFVCAFKHRLSE